MIEELGSDAFVFCSAELPGGATRLVARVPARAARPSAASGCDCGRAPEYAPHVFDADTGERIGA